MLLILTSKEDATADYLCDRIGNKSSFVRLNTDTIEQSSFEFNLSGAQIVHEGHSITLQDVKTVWYRRPLPVVPKSETPLGRHAAREVGAALEGMLALIPIDLWVNHPAHNAIASAKIEQIFRARQFSLNVPDTVVTSNPNTLKAFWRSCNGEVIVKPLYAGYVERLDGTCEWVIYTSRITLEHVQQSENTLPGSPTLFQRLVNKQADVRVTVLDDKVWAVRMAEQLDSEQRLDIRRDNMKGVSHEAISLPQEILSKLLALVRSYKLRFAAVDFVIDNYGEWYFLEINPNGQWAWQDVLGVTSIADHFITTFAN